MAFRSFDRWRPNRRREDWQYPLEEQSAPGGRTTERVPHEPANASWVYTEWWWVPGPYTGRGPRGYQRSDERICEDVCERLAQHGELDASDIAVETEGSEVTLTGNVDSRRAKRLAEDIAESVSGVTDIHNQLRIHRMDYERSQVRNRQTSGRPASARQIEKDMPVLDSNGIRIGSVKEIRDNDFLMNRPMNRDVYVPFDAITEISDRVALNVASEQVDLQGWQQPMILETPPPVQGEYRP